MSEHLEPARTIVYRLGGPAKVARSLGLNNSRPYRWMRPKSEGGTGGTIPSKHQQALLDLAHELGVDLGPADFFVRRNRSLGNALSGAAA